MPLAKKKAKKAEPEVVINFPQKYYIIGADLSLKRPGFCKLTIEDSKLTDIHLMSVDNKKDTKKEHGELLDEIMKAFIEFIPDPEKDTTLCYYIREKEIINQATPYERNISKVVGLTDWLLWRLHCKWEEIYPVTIKKCIAGNGRSDKKAVADNLPYYVGNIQYANDDESDATAVAITWLIQHGQLTPKGGEQQT